MRVFLRGAVLRAALRLDVDLPDQAVFWFQFQLRLFQVPQRRLERLVLGRDPEENDRREREVNRRVRELNERDPKQALQDEVRGRLEKRLVRVFRRNEVDAMDETPWPAGTVRGHYRHVLRGVGTAPTPGPRSAPVAETRAGIFASSC